MAHEKEDSSVVEDISKNGPAVNVLDLDSRVLQLANECPPFYKNRNLLSLYLLVSPFHLDCKMATRLACSRPRSNNHG